MLHELCVIFLRQLTHILRNILITDVEALVVIVHFRTHGDKVDDAAKIGFRAIGSWMGTALHFKRSFIMSTTL